MRKRKQGFTLIELMIVLALLAILATLTLPSFAGLKEDSKRRLCEENRNIMQGSYLVRRNLKNGELPNESLAAVQKQFEGTETMLCPSGGTYTLRVSGGGSTLNVTCSEHGGGSLYGQDLGALLGGIITNFDKKVTRYDSEAIGLINSDGNVSHSTQIEEELKRQGLTTEGTAWSVEMKGGEIATVCWMEDSFSEQAVVGGKALVLRYNKSWGTYTVGYVKIATSKLGSETYLTFNGVGVDEYKSDGVQQTDTTKKDFKQAYALYLKAREELANQGLSEYQDTKNQPIKLDN